MKNKESYRWLDRRQIVVALAAGAALVFGSGAMAAPDEAAQKLLPDDIKQKGVLIAAMPLDFEPFNYLDAQNVQVGLDVDLFHAIGEILGLKTEIQRMGFASIVPAVKGGRVRGRQAAPVSYRDALRSGFARDRTCDLAAHSREAP